LPETYAEWIKHWYELFPLTYDNKVLCQYSRYFHKTVLGILFDKCSGDEAFKNILQFGFDKRNGCVNYEGSTIGAHCHEAAYDAHMTGLVFGMVVKRKEID